MTYVTWLQEVQTAVSTFKPCFYCPLVATEQNTQFSVENSDVWEVHRRDDWMTNILFLVTLEMWASNEP